MKHEIICQKFENKQASIHTNVGILLKYSIPDHYEMYAV